MKLTWVKVRTDLYRSEPAPGIRLELEQCEGTTLPSGWYLHSALACHEGVSWLGDDLYDACRLAGAMVTDEHPWLLVNGASHLRRPMPTYVERASWWERLRALVRRGHDS